MRPTTSERNRRHVTAPSRFRVLKERFVYKHGGLTAPAAPERRQSRPGEFEKGDVFDAQPCTLLRRAQRDGDIELVPASEEATATGHEPTASKRPARAGAKEPQ